MQLIVTRMHIECHCIREHNNNIFPVAFWNLEQPNYRTSRSPFAISRGFHIIYLQCWVKRMWFWPTNKLSNGIMTRQDLGATDWILWDFISGHLIHLHLVYIYCHSQNMIAIVTVRPNLILGRQYLFSPHIGPSLFIFWENMTCYSKKYPFSIALNLGFKIFVKGKNRSSNFLSREPPIGWWKKTFIGQFVGEKSWNMSGSSRNQAVAAWWQKIGWKPFCGRRIMNTQPKSQRVVGNSWNKYISNVNLSLEIYETNISEVNLSLKNHEINRLKVRFSSKNHETSIS
jgi:hypothetical protein